MQTNMRAFPRQKKATLYRKKVRSAKRKTTGFLDLPTELRLQIYELAIPTGYKYTTISGSSGLTNYMSASYPGVIFTCKQIQAETAFSWAEQNSFRIDVATRYCYRDHVVTLFMQRMKLINGTKNLKVELQFEHDGDLDDPYSLDMRPALLTLSMRYDRSRFSGRMKLFQVNGVVPSKEEGTRSFQPNYDMVFRTLKQANSDASKAELEFEVFVIGHEDED